MHRRRYRHRHKSKRSTPRLHKRPREVGGRKAGIKDAKPKRLVSYAFGSEDGQTLSLSQSSQISLSYGREPDGRQTKHVTVIRTSSDTAPIYSLLSPRRLRVIVVSYGEPTFSPVRT